MSKVKGLNKSGLDKSRSVGEVSTESMAQAKKSSRFDKKFRRNIPITCGRCEEVTVKFSLVALREFKKSGRTKWLCWDCRAAEQREVNQAILAVYNRRSKK